MTLNTVHRQELLRLIEEFFQESLLAQLKLIVVALERLIKIRTLFGSLLNLDKQRETLYQRLSTRGTQRPKIVEEKSYLHLVDNALSVCIGSGTSQTVTWLVTLGKSFSSRAIS